MPTEFEYTEIRGWDQVHNSYGKTFLREATESLISNGYMGGHPELPNGCSIIFARHGKKIIGCVAFTFAHDLNGIYMHVAYVAPGYRAMGAFTCMVEIIKERARELGMATVNWEVLESNTSMHAVSRKLGKKAVTRYEVEV